MTRTAPNLCFLGQRPSAELLEIVSSGHVPKSTLISHHPHSEGLPIWGAEPSKTHRLWCFQTALATHQFRSLWTALRVVLHQLENLWEVLKGAAAARPILWKLRPRPAKWRQEVKTCWIVSSAWSYKGQEDGWGKPVLERWSAVQHLLLLLMASQMKNLDHRVSKLFSRVRI